VCAVIALAAVLVPIVGRRTKADEELDSPSASSPADLDGAGVTADDSLQSVGHTQTHGAQADGAPS
jgi:hypothetical protein